MPGKRRTRIMTDQLPIIQRRRTARPKTPDQLSQGYPISIIIPFYNCVGQLCRTIPALAQNDLHHCEVLLIDDGSTDGSGRFARDFDFGAPSRLLPIRSRSGPAQARNLGLREAQYPHVFFLDADVVLPANALFWIRESLDVYCHRPEVQGVLGVYAADIPGAGFFTHFKNLYTCYLYDSTRTLSPFIHTPIFCVRKQVIEEVKGFDGRLETAEDFRLGISLGSRGYRFVIDRRIQGVHLKTYSLGSILREDKRRIVDLRRVEVAPGESEFYYRAHRWSRILSVLLPGATVLSLILSMSLPGFKMFALVLVLLFYGLNWRFLAFCRRKRGLPFTLRAALFLPMEMVWASWAGFTASLFHRRLPAGSEHKTV